MKQIPNRNLTGLAILSIATVAWAQGTAFTYQGRLEDGATPASGVYNLRFSIYDASTGGNQRGLLTNTANAVSDGLFTTPLDFGFGLFKGGPRWLELAVRSNGTSAAFTPLLPRQPVSPAPYPSWAANASQAVSALTASNVPAVNITGTLPGANLGGT